jgi:hypothetical protein
MNERIRELEATLNDLYQGRRVVVRECIAQCEKNVDHEYLGWGSKLSAFNIKQHFGVEE